MTDKEYFKQHYQKNRAKRLAQGKKRYWDNPKAKHEYDAARRKRLGESLLIQRRKYKIKIRGTPKAMWQRSRDRAAKDGIPFDIEISDIFIPEKCPALGIPLTSIAKSGGHNGSPSLDRIIPELGYVKGNIVVISKRANAIKQNCSAEEILSVGKWLLNMIPPSS